LVENRYFSYPLLTKPPEENGYEYLCAIFSQPSQIAGLSGDENVEKVLFTRSPSASQTDKRIERQAEMQSQIAERLLPDAR